MSINNVALRRSIETVLESIGGELFSLSLAQKGNSAYALVGFPDTRYDVFRVSNHKAYKSFFSHPTFSFYEQNHEKFEKQLADYLSRANRVKFDGKDYFVLKSICCASKYNTTYFVDDSYAQFAEGWAAVIFYQEHGFIKKKAQISIVDEEISQLFRKLYADGFINTFEKNKNIQLYVTSLGMEMLQRTQSFFDADFKADLANIRWWDISLPQRYR